MFITELKFKKIIIYIKQIKRGNLYFIYKIELVYERCRIFELIMIKNTKKTVKY